MATSDIPGGGASREAVEPVMKLPNNSRRYPQVTI